MMNSSFATPRKPTTVSPPHPEPSTAGIVYDDKQPIPRKTTSSSTKRRSAQLIQERDDVADTGKRLKQSSSSSDDGNVAFPAPSNNLTTTVSASTDEEDAMVLSLFEKLNSCIEEDGLELDDIEDMIKANEYLINAKCPQAMTKVEAGCTLMEALCCLNVNHAYARDLLYEVVCLGGKATDTCYKYVMDQAEWSMPLNHLLVLLLSGYFPTKKSNFFLDELAEGFDEDEEEWYSDIVRILYKDISLGDNLSCGDVDSTVLNNINELPPLVIGETHAEGGPMGKLLIRFPSTKIICSSCKASKLAWRFSEEHNCCQECVLKCSTCNVLKRRLDQFTAEQSKKEYNACCMECEVLLVCSACKVSKSSGLFSESQKSRGEAAWCDKCEMIYLVCSTCRVLKNKSHHFTKVQRKKGEAAVCKECQVAKAPVVDTHCTMSVNKIKTPVTDEQGKKRGEQRICSACNMSKNRDKFSRNQLGKGERARCKECLGN